MADSTGFGHGGLNDFDPGGVKNGRTELQEAKKVNAYFRQWNPDWVDVSDRVGRTISQNLINIVNTTNRVGKSFQRTYSHHFNMFNGKATGVEIWYFAGDAVMKKQAERACAAISKVLGIVNRGAKATTSLYVVANTYPHCLLIEWCFLDNPNDMKAWDRNGAKAMNACMKALNMKYPPDAPVQKPVIYQTKKGHYTALRDDIMYLDAALSKKSGWIIKKGQRLYVSKIVGIGAKGRYTRACLHIDGNDHFFTLRDDFWVFK